MPSPVSGKVIPTISPQAAKAALAADDGKPGSVAKQEAKAAEKSQAEAKKKEPEKKEEPKKTWYGFKVLDAAGKPVKNEKCKVTLPDGSEKTLKTDGSGMVKVEDVDPGKPVSIRLADRFDYEWAFDRVDDAP